MLLHFVSGNKNKFEEVKMILGDVDMVDLDLPEIQEINPRKILDAKLKAAFEYVSEEVLIEDISLYLECLNGLPGPLIKWFLKTMGTEGLANIADKLHNNSAIAKVVYGYAKNISEIEYFEGEIRGTIVSPRGERGFGWDFIFQPEGYGKTFAEMSIKEKNEISMRKIALEKLKLFLQGK